MADPKPRIKLPKSVEKGEIVEIKTLISHVMESGQRKDSKGNIIPRQIINRFTCTMNGEEVFAMDIEPAISANPYISFSVRVDEPTEFVFSWYDDNGKVYQKTSKVDIK